MHVAHLITFITAFVAAMAAPSAQKDGSELPAPSMSKLEVRQPLNAFHGSRGFMDGSTNAVKRGHQRHGRAAQGHTPNKRAKTQTRKVKKRSGSCAAKTSSATLSVTKSATDYYVSSSAAAATSTPNLNNGAVDLLTSSASSTTAQSTRVTSIRATSTSTSSSAPATTSSASTWTSVDPDGNGPFSGEITYYDLGTDGSAIGACGTNLVDSDKIAAAAASLFDSWPGATANPNTNPICGQYAKVSSGSASVIVQIQDRCPGCDERHLDLSPSAFLELAELSVGLMDVSWEWIETSSG